MTERPINAMNFPVSEYYKDTIFADTSRPITTHPTIDIQETAKGNKLVTSKQVRVDTISLFPDGVIVPIGQEVKGDLIYSFNESAVRRWREAGTTEAHYQELSLWPFVDSEVNSVFRNMFDMGEIPEADRLDLLKRELPNCVISPESGIELIQSDQKIMGISADQTFWIARNFSEAVERDDSIAFRYQLDGSPPYSIEFDTPYYYGDDEGTESSVATLTSGLSFSNLHIREMVEELEYIIGNDGSFTDITKIITPYIHPKFSDRD